MTGNKIVKYDDEQLNKAKKLIEVTNKLLSIEKRGNLFAFFNYFPITTIYCEMGHIQSDNYNKLKNSIRANIFSEIDQKGFENCKLVIFKGLTSLRLACFSTIKVNIKETDNININSIKTEFIINELYKLRNFKVFIVSPYDKILDSLAYIFSKNDLSYGQFDGRTYSSDTLSIFNDSKSSNNILLASSKCIHGININIDFIFLVNPSGYYGKLIDVIARSHPFNQNMKVYALICKDTIEEKLIPLENRINDPLKFFNLIKIDEVKKLFS